MTNSHAGLESGLCLIPLGQRKEGSIALLLLSWLVENFFLSSKSQD